MKEHYVQITWAKFDENRGRFTFDNEMGNFVI